MITQINKNMYTLVLQKRRNHNKNIEGNLTIPPVIMEELKCIFFIVPRIMKKILWFT